MRDDAGAVTVEMMVLVLRRQPMQAFTKQRNAGESSQQETA